jgi:hypothetical protein
VVRVEMVEINSVFLYPRDNGFPPRRDDGDPVTGPALPRGFGILGDALDSGSGCGPFRIKGLELTKGDGSVRAPGRARLAREGERIA